MSGNPTPTPRPHLFNMAGFAIAAALIVTTGWIAYGIQRDPPPQLASTSRGTELQRPTIPPGKSRHSGFCGCSSE